MKQIDISTPTNPNTFAIVDDSDYQEYNLHKWTAIKGWNTLYACRVVQKNYIQRYILMHREILGLKKGDGKLVDHKNGNGLYNCRHNLRICTSAENLRNRKTSHGRGRYKGVNWHKATGKWVAKITVNYIQKHLGVFTDEDEAAIAYNVAAVKYHGEFANLNDFN